MPSGRSACAARAVLTENRGLLTFEKAAHVLVSTGKVRMGFAVRLWRWMVTTIAPDLGSD